MQQRGAHLQRRTISALRISMKTPVLCTVIFLLAIHRLPAPIVEEATPEPTASARPNRVSIPKPKPRAATFVGTWGGVTIGSCSSDNVNHSNQFRVIISADEQTIAWQMDGQATQQLPCYRTGDTLHSDSNSNVVTSIVTLRMNPGGKSLSYSARSTINSWPMKGVVCTASGTLMRQ